MDVAEDGDVNPADSDLDVTNRAVDEVVGEIDNDCVVKYRDTKVNGLLGSVIKDGDNNSSDTGLLDNVILTVENVFVSTVKLSSQLSELRPVKSIDELTGILLLTIKVNVSRGDNSLEPFISSVVAKICWLSVVTEYCKEETSRKGVKPVGKSVSKFDNNLLSEGYKAEESNKVDDTSFDESGLKANFMVVISEFSELNKL